MWTRPRLAGVATALVLGVLVTAGPVAADTLTFVKDNNVWLSNAEGSGLYQVTLDGTAAAPYETPSLADDGTVVAIRQTPGQRRQIYRMSQSGALLNPPINTPAPGTGAIDGKVSPDGKLVAYWFVTTVFDPTCTFCVDVANRVLLSHSDRFTNADEVGTPNTGGWPSWLSNTTITLGSGSATQWYYTLGMPEAAEWFNDGDITGEIKTLLDAEVAPSGDRLAFVRGDNQETILILKMNGAPPTKPSIANAACDGLANPNGKFVDPTWSANGQTLAWQENDGVWTIAVPSDLTNCGGFGAAALRIAGAKNPDFGSAALNPGPRPACGNPGNPAGCPTPGPGPSPSPTPGPGPGPNPTPVCCAIDPASFLPTRLNSLLSQGAKSLARLRIRGVLRRGGFTVTFDAPMAGTLAVKLTTGAGAGRSARVSRQMTIANGRRVFSAPGKATFRVKLTKLGKKLLRRAKRLRATLGATFTPKTGNRATAKKGFTLR